MHIIENTYELLNGLGDRPADRVGHQLHCVHDVHRRRLEHAELRVLRAPLPPARMADDHHCTLDMLHPGAAAFISEHFKSLSCAPIISSGTA